MRTSAIRALLAMTATAGLAVLGATATASAAPSPHSAAALTAAMTSLNGVHGVPNTAWGVDPSTSQLVVTVSDAANGPGMARLNAVIHQLGDSVRVNRSHGQLTPQIYDGEEISTGQIICSTGFNVRSGSQLYIITAGHCTQGGPSWQGIGPSVDSSFPGNDYGLIRNDSGSGPGAVDLYNGYAQSITSAGNAYVGEQVCKSGRTTGQTCGQVTGLNQTVNYGNGDVVYGLIQTNVYSDHGDSGGALYDGSVGLGTVSGGDSTTDYFQPLPEALSAYGVSLT